MKIRTGFVTNSSSSSYIVAFKDVKKYEGWDAFPDFVKHIIERYMDMAVKGSTIISTKAELDKHFISNYGYKEEFIEELLETEGEGSWMWESYNKQLAAIESGYAISDVSVDYNDTTGSDFYRSLKSKDDGIGLYLVEECN
jgi:hypothetical protein